MTVLQTVALPLGDEADRLMNLAVGGRDVNGLLEAG
jgi:hypothetical protein